MIASFVSEQNRGLPDDWEESRPSLRPKVWSRVTIETMDLDAQLKGTQVLDTPLVPVGEHLYASVVYDMPTSLASVSTEQLATWGVSLYEALEAARDNLRACPSSWLRAGDSLARAVVGDSYESARLLLIDSIRELGLGGTPIAVAPCRDSLLVAGEDDPDAIRTLLTLVREDVQELARPLSPLPLILRDDEWVDWEPPVGHPARPLFDELAVHYYADAYGTQRELLEALQEARAEPAGFVATYFGLKSTDTGLVTSACAWGRGVDSLLPRTERIDFVDEEGVIASGTWSHVQQVAGELLEPDGRYFPPRYRAREFPSDEQLDRIGRLPRGE
ncbi:MAG: hypothetical protein R3F62_21380 [Planctomycetota bacterium]